MLRTTMLMVTLQINNTKAAIPGRAKDRVYTLANWNETCNWIYKQINNCHQVAFIMVILPTSEWSTMTSGSNEGNYSTNLLSRKYQSWKQLSAEDVEGVIFISLRSKLFICARNKLLKETVGKCLSMFWRFETSTKFAFKHVESLFPFKSLVIQYKFFKLV